MTVVWSMRRISNLLRWITGPFSIIASCIVVYMVLAGKGKKSSYHRFLLAISLSDIGFTIALMFVILPLPKGTTPGAMGNMTTCELRAFILQWLGTLGPLYNVCLEFYFVAVICYRVSQNNFAKHYEKWMHIIINLFAITTAIVGIVAQVFNPGIGELTGCYINPPKCTSDDEATCTSEFHRTRAYFFFLGILPYYIVLFLLYGSLILIVWTVLRKDCQTRKFRQQHSPHLQQQSRRGRRSSVLSITRPATMQAILYGILYSLTYLLHATVRNIVFFDNLARTNRGVQVLSFFLTIFFPLQGVFNLFLYIKPKFNKLSKAFPSKSFCWTLWMSISRKTIQEIAAQVYYDDTIRRIESCAPHNDGRNDDDVSNGESSLIMETETISKRHDKDATTSDDDCCCVVVDGTENNNETQKNEGPPDSIVIAVHSEIIPKGGHHN